MIEQRGTIKAAFHAVDGTIDRITTTVQTDYNFIYLRGRDLRPLNYEVFSARRVFRHVGINVTLKALHFRGT